MLEKPIKALGVTAAKVQLHPEVLSNITLNIARSQDEADKQSKGENVSIVKDEAMELETFKGEMFEEGSGPDGRVILRGTLEIPDREVRDFCHWLHATCRSLRACGALATRDRAALGCLYPRATRPLMSPPRRPDTDCDSSAQAHFLNSLAPAC